MACSSWTVRGVPAIGNAYFTGFGKSRRIVFFDTLLSRLNGDEIEAVLAHELGHFARRHISRRIAVSFAVALGFFALLGWLARQPWFYEQLGVLPRLDGRNDAMALLLFFLVVPVFTFLFTPVASWYSRRDEFQADRLRGPPELSRSNWCRRWSSCMTTTRPP